MPTSERCEHGGRPAAARRAGLRGLCGAVTMAGVVLGSAPARADDWASLGLDAARTRATHERSGTTFGSREWRYALPAVADPINRVLVSSPAVADGVLVLGTTTGEIIAFGAGDGKVRWRFRTRDGVHASPAIVRGRVFVPSFDGTLYALALSSGKTLWTKSLGSVTFSSPAPAEDSVIVATGFPARKLLRLDAATGNTIWETPAAAMDQASNSSVAIAGNRVVLGTMAGHYYGFDLATGSPVWKYDATGAVHLGAPTVVGSTAYFAPGGEAHSIYAVDVRTGSALAGWPIDIPDLPAETGAGTVKAHDYAVSSLALAGNLLLLQQRTLELIDADGDPAAAVDTFLMREETIAVNRTTRAVAWRTASGRVMSQDRSAIPAFGVCPTPLVYADRGGRLLAITASTLTSQVRVLDVVAGTEVSSRTVSAPTRGSPALANGRLFVATDAGVVHSLLSAGNQPPLLAVSASMSPATVPAVGAVLNWPRAVDPDGDATTYTLRLDSDGEILSTWDHELTLTGGETSTRLPWALQAGATYTYSVRARDTNGAWSDWMPSRTFQTVATPDVSVGGLKGSSLADVLAVARPGDVVQLGAGTFRLAEGVSVPSGVVMTGAGPQQTILDGSGLDTAVSMRGASSTQTTGIQRLTVAGGRIGVSVADAPDAVLRNVVVRDAREAAIDIAADGAAHVINATLVHDGVGLRAAGQANIRNSLIIDNGSGLVALSGGAVTSNYNDVHGNQTAYGNVVPGGSDLDTAVAFAGASDDDFHLKANQPTTDRGNPDDDWGNEPAPAGARINLGAFGNTAEAETSGESAGPPATTPPPDGPPPTTTPPDPTPSAPTPTSATPSPTAPHPSPVTVRDQPSTDRSQSGCEVGGRDAPTAAAAFLGVLLGVMGARRRPRRTAAVCQRDGDGDGDD